MFYVNNYNLQQKVITQQQRCREEFKSSLTSGRHHGLPSHWLQCTYLEVQVPGGRV